MFWNIKDQLNRTFEQRNCSELASDFVEIKLMTENYLAKKGIEFDLKNTTLICPAGTVRIEMNMTSGNLNIFDNFTLVSHNP